MIPGGLRHAGGALIYLQGNWSLVARSNAKVQLALSFVHKVEVNGMAFPAPNPPFIAARWFGGAQVPKRIVIHGTVTPCANGWARKVANFFANGTNKTSAHYTVDPGEVIQSVGDHKVAFHCGRNQDTIGVELCDPQTGPGSRWGDASHRLMLMRAATLVAELCLAYDIPANRLPIEQIRAGQRGIYSHNDSRLAFPGSTSHVDPGPDFPWPMFISAVRNEIARLRGAPVVASGNRWTRTRTRLLNALNHEDAQNIDTRRVAIRAFLATTRRALRTLPKQ